MRIICSRNALLNGINTVSKAVSSKTTADILSCMLIDASSGEISLVGNDTELGIETIIDGTIDEPGVVAVDAKLIFEVIRKLHDSDEIIISTTPEFQINIKCGRREQTINGRSGDNYVYLPAFERNSPYVVSQFSFKEAIRQTIFAVSDDNTNAILKGEYFVFNENNLKITALNGHLVAIRNIELKENYPSTSVIVPGKTLSEVIKVVPGNASDDIDIYITDNHIIFEYDTTTIISRIITGEFVNVDRIVSYNYETDFMINKKDFLDSLDGSLTYVKEGDKKPIIFDVTDDKITVSIKNSPIGNYDEELDIQKEGKDIVIGFNPRTFMDALKAIDEEEIHVYMINSKAPCFIKDDDETFKYLVLPVNFS